MKGNIGNRTPKVTVIVPVYGVEKYIERCARSLFEQTLDDIEYLFIDDCTPDRSIEILKSVLEEYPNRKEQVIIHQMEQNSGQAKVREWGMKNATGAYVIHCDSDDWVDTDMYHSMYEKAKEENADVVVCDFVITDGLIINKNIGCLNTDGDLFFRDCCSMKTSWSLCNKLVKTSIIKKGVLYPQHNMGEDMVIMLQILSKANRISYISSPFYNYFENNLSITNSIEEESIVNRSKQYFENSKLVIKAIHKDQGAANYDDEILFIKWIARRNLWMLTDQWKYFKQWKAIWPEIDRCIWGNKYIYTFDKVKYVLTYLRLYPLLPKVYRKLFQNKR